MLVISQRDNFNKKRKGFFFSIRKKKTHPFDRNEFRIVSKGHVTKMQN